MSAIPFSRSVGARSGVQLNYIQDESERFVGNDSGQVFAGVARLTRGRIDRAFEVDRDKMLRTLGAPVSPLVNALNESLIHVYEAFSFGAQRAVISRLVPEAAKLKWMVAKDKATAAVGETPAVPVWSVSEATPTANFLLAIKHFECFNEGVTAEIHAVAAEDEAGDPVASKWVRIRLIDINGAELYSFEGSLDPLAKNDFGETAYLPSIVSAQTDELEVIVAASASVPLDSNYYGQQDLVDKVDAAKLEYFDEGGTTYAPTDIDRAVNALKSTMFPYGYLAGLGTQSVALIAKLAALGKEINKQFVVDVPGNLNLTAAIAFAAQFNIDSHYVQWYWAPLKAIDPLNGGKSVFGVSGAQVGLRCQRNARVDANGVPPKNYPIAGKNWPLPRTGIAQIADVDDQDLERLAKAKINPVIFQTYNSGSAFVFYDSLTAAKTEADRKLIAVAEMSSQVDDWVTAAVKEFLQLPITDAVKRTTDYLQILFEGLQTGNWLVPSAALGGSAWVATVIPNAQKPKTHVDVRYSLSYDGTTRVITVQQTISR